MNRTWKGEGGGRCQTEEGRPAERLAAAEAILRRHRVGCVPYLNAKPLIHGIEHVELLPPSELSDRFLAGAYDVALLPTYELLRVGAARLVDGAAIACRGRVFSVILAHRGELAEIERVALDPASRTSVNLLRLLFAEFYELRPAFVETPEDDSMARLIIGDAAMTFRAAHPEGWRFLDLGQAWWRFTGLPFVFACWALTQKCAEPAALADALRTVQSHGMAARKAIAAQCSDPSFAYRYLTRFVRFDMAAEEKRAIALFSRLLRKHGLLDPDVEPRLELL
jgi:chorismate dehydratase